MKINGFVICADSPCLDTHRASYFLTSLDVDLAALRIKEKLHATHPIG